MIAESKQDIRQAHQDALDTPLAWTEDDARRLERVAQKLRQVSRGASQLTASCPSVDTPIAIHSHIVATRGQIQ